jgi:hypothetical protein
VRHNSALFLFLRATIIQDNERQHNDQRNQAKGPNDLTQRANMPDHCATFGIPHAVQQAANPDQDDLSHRQRQHQHKQRFCGRT